MSFSCILKVLKNQGLIKYKVSSKEVKFLIWKDLYPPERLPFRDTGPTSAYPGHYPRPWLLRASFSPVASGWHLLHEVTDLTEGQWGLLRSQSPLLISLGRCSPPGFSAVHAGQNRRLPAPYPVSFCLQRLSLLRWLPDHDGSTTPSLALPIDIC